VDECPICEKHRGEGPLVGEPVYEDAHVLASHAPASADGYLGYVFVETKRHARSLGDLSDDEASAAGTAISRLARALETEGAENVYCFVFDHIPHHHAHVVARWPGTPEEFWGTRVTDWPDAPRGGPSEIEELCGRLRARLTAAG
jgi:diadenosine tetraphosphate (Ap4A) HIT family hydrolase